MRARAGVTTARQGFALVATVVLILLVGAAVTIGFYSAAPVPEQPMTAAERAAADAAQGGIREALHDWDATRLASLGPRGDTTIVGRLDAQRHSAADYVVNIGRTGVAEFTIAATGSAIVDGQTAYCTVVVRTRLKGGRLAERGATIDRKCRTVV